MNVEASFSTRLLFPDGEGRPVFRLIAASSRPSPPQPLAPGTAKESSPWDAPDRPIRSRTPPVGLSVPSPSNRVTSVVGADRFFGLKTIGLAFEPMGQGAAS